MGSPRNPFSSHRVCPGALAHVASGEVPGGPPPLDELARAWFAAGRRGLLLGPHGTGKSTVLHHLGAWLRAEHRGGGPCGREVRLCRMPGPADWWWCARHGHRAVLLWDSAENCPVPRAATTRLVLAITRAGCVATAHRPMWGWPALLRTQVQPAVGHALVCRLLHGAAPLPDGSPYPVPTPGGVAQMLERAGGNMREVLFALYDDYEARYRAALERPRPDG